MLTIEFTSSNQPGLTFDQATATNAVYLGSNGTIYATLQGNLFPVSLNDVDNPSDNSLGDEVARASVPDVRFVQIASEYVIRITP